MEKKCIIKKRNAVPIHQCIKFYYRYIGNGRTHDDFVAYIFWLITENFTNSNNHPYSFHDTTHPICDRSPTYLRQLFSETESLTESQISWMMSHLDLSKFIDLIHCLPLDTRMLLCKELQEKGYSDITLENMDEKCADLFVSIVLHAPKDK